MSSEQSASAAVLSPSIFVQARTLLDYELSEIAFAVRLPVRDLEAYEAGLEPLPDPALARLRRYYELTGVRFTPGGRDRGVRLASMD